MPQSRLAQFFFQLQIHKNRIGFFTGINGILKHHNKNKCETKNGKRIRKIKWGKKTNNPKWLALTRCDHLIFSTYIFCTPNDHDHDQ